MSSTGPTELYSPDADAEDDLFSFSDSDEESSSPCTRPNLNGPIEEVCAVATDYTPPVPGLYLFPELIPQHIANGLLKDIIANDTFQGGQLNQVMLFTSSRGATQFPSDPFKAALPRYVSDLIRVLDEKLRPELPPGTHGLCFDPFAQVELDTVPLPDTDPDSMPRLPLARQVILNLYAPPSPNPSSCVTRTGSSSHSYGISPHIDLPHRYADGIVGISLGWGEGVVMDFEREETENVASLDPGGEETQAADRSISDKEEIEKGGSVTRKHSVWLPNRSVYVLCGPARWHWRHGISERDHDIIAVPTIQKSTGADAPGEKQYRVKREERDVRVSITLRWLKPGGDVLSVPVDSG